MDNLSLKEGSINNFDKIFEDMSIQFPPEEMKSREKFKKLLSKDFYKFYLLKDKSTTTGYIIFFEDKKYKTIWIDYIAIFKNFHSHGYGTKIFNILKDSMKEISGCYLEVEKENKNDINTTRRISFYTKLGAKKIDIDYYYPNHNGGIAMDLYFMPFNNTCIPDNKEVTTAIKNTFDAIHSDIKDIDKIFSKIKII